MVRVVQQVAADQVLENFSSGGQVGLEALQWRFKSQGRQGVGVVQPEGQALEHGRQPSGEAAAVAFAQAEFHAV